MSQMEKMEKMKKTQKRRRKKQKRRKDGCFGLWTSKFKCEFEPQFNGHITLYSHKITIHTTNTILYHPKYTLIEPKLSTYSTNENNGNFTVKPNMPVSPQTLIQPPQL
jgi:hypothetical protein